MSPRSYPVLSALALSLLSLAGCAPGDLGDLGAGTMYVVIAEGGGFCSSAYAVDPDGDVWTESGCESSTTGLVQEDLRVSEAERAELAALLEAVLALPPDGDCVVVSPSERRFRFGRVEADGTSREVLQCAPGVDADARELATRLEGLTSP